MGVSGSITDIYTTCVLIPGLELAKKFEELEQVRGACIDAEQMGQKPLVCQ